MIKVNPYSKQNYYTDQPQLRKTYDMKSIRKAVLDELHGACFGGGFGAAMVEFEDAKRASDEELLKIARRNGINIEKYRK